MESYLKVLSEGVSKSHNFARGEERAPRIREEEDIYETIAEASALNEAGVVGNVLGILFFGPVLWLAWRAILAATDKCQNKCGMLKISNTRDACVSKCQQIELNQKEKLIKRGVGECSKKRDNNECRQKARTAISKINVKRQKLKARAKK